LGRRNATRIPFKTTAIVSQGGEPSLGEVRDVSLNGLYIATRCGYGKGENISVSLVLEQGDITLSVTVPCVISRASDSGIGCVARSFDPESLFSLDNLIRSHKDDSSGIMEAFLGYLNLSEATANL